MQEEQQPFYGQLLQRMELIDKADKADASFGEIQLTQAEQEELAKQHIDSGPFRHAAADEILCRLLDEYIWYGPPHKRPGAKRILDIYRSLHDMWYE